MAKRVAKLWMAVLFLFLVVVLVVLAKGARKGFEDGDDDLYIAPSDVEGVGVFVGRGFAAGELVLVAVEPHHQITALGSKVNHCASRANVVLKEAEPGTWNLYATRDLQPGQEILADYHDTPDFIAKPDPSWTC